MDTITILILAKSHKYKEVALANTCEYNPTHRHLQSEGRHIISLVVKEQKYDYPRGRCQCNSS